MDQQDTPQAAALTPYELTFAPGYYASGAPIHPRASRQVLSQRLTAQVQAATPEGAIDAFERREDRMVTACTRVQLAGAWA